MFSVFRSLGGLSVCFFLCFMLLAVFVPYLICVMCYNIMLVSLLILLHASLILMPLRMWFWEFLYEGRDPEALKVASKAFLLHNNNMLGFMFLWLYLGFLVYI